MNLDMKYMDLDTRKQLGIEPEILPSKEIKKPKLLMKQKPNTENIYAEMGLIWLEFISGLPNITNLNQIERYKRLKQYYSNEKKMIKIIRKIKSR